MKQRNLVISLVASITVLVLSAGYLALGNAPQLGLDLRGGISAIYTPVLEEGAERPEDFDEVLDETIAIIRDRVDSLGVAEPEISRQGDDVLVQLPGLDDPERARQIIGTTAKLNFRPVEAIVYPGTPEYDTTPACDDPDYPVPAEDEPGLVCSADDEGVPVLQPPGDPASPGATELPTGGASPSPGSTETSTEQSLGARVRGAAVGDVVPLAQASPSPEVSPASSPTATDDAEIAPTPTGTEPTVVPTGPTLPLKYRVGPAALSGDEVEGAQASIATGSWTVLLDLDADGADKFAEITSQLACQRDQGQSDQLAIVLDGRVESAPSMNPTVGCGEGITGGSATISVGGTGAADGGEQEARDLALVLKTGALPITLEPSTFETVSPTLGANSLQSGLIAGLIGLALVAVYLLFFYRVLGLVAIGALSLFGVVVVAMIAAMGKAGFTLTLAGIAGLVVSIGITADSSIIFFERIRDEVNLGKTVRTSVQRAFDSAFRTNLAGNTVTLAAAVILYFLAVGPVRGFAFTLGLATILDVMILYFYSRAAVGLLSRTRVLSRRSVRASDPAPAAGGNR